jgi:hypothetical protein
MHSVNSCSYNKFMDLATEPDVYCPSVNDLGQYIDKIPAFTTLFDGIRCVCGARRDKVYKSHAVFASHIKTKTHQKWLCEINVSQPNLYKENIEMKQTIRNQRLIISRMDAEMSEQLVTIGYLTKCMNADTLEKEKEKNRINLLDFD